MKKILLGIVTFWPLLYIFIFLGFIFSMFMSFNSNSTPPIFLFGTIFGLHFLTMLIIFALMIIYIVNVFKNDRVSSDKKALWAIVLLMGGIIAMPIYWYLYIWKENKSSK